MADWLVTAAGLMERGERFVIVGVSAVRGSAPRETGARMIVTAKESIGTIGGGELEHQGTRIACEYLAAGGRAGRHKRRFVLGADCGQCCGGVVEVVFEVVAGRPDWLVAASGRYREGGHFVLVSGFGVAQADWLVTDVETLASVDAGRCPGPVIEAAKKLLSDTGPAVSVGDFLLERIGFSGINLAVFGAGHVGAALVDVLSRVDSRLRWVDSRRGFLPPSTPDGVLAVQSAEPAREVLAMPPGSYYLIATHSHPLDLEIVSAVLGRRDFAYCGLIGSRSKRQRFRRRLREQGIADEVIGRLTCPIGVSGIAGRKPVEIALATAAEILQVRDRDAAGSRPVALEVLR